MYLSSISSRLLLYDINSWDLKKSYGCYDSVLRHISWSDDSKYLLQVNSKGSVEILSAADNDVRSLQHIPLKDSWSASFQREGHRNVAIGTKSGNVLIWDTKYKSITKTFPTPPYQSCVNHISYNAKNTSLAASMQNGNTIIYGLVSNIPVLTIKLQCSKSISAMKFHHDSRSLLGLATEEGHLILRDITTNKDKTFFENVHASPVSDFVYSYVNKDVMLSCGYDRVMHVYDVRLQSVVSKVRTTHTLTSLDLNSDNQVALGTKHGVILLYDLRDLTTPMKVLKGHDEEVRKVAFQPIQKRACSTEISLREETNQTTPVKELGPHRNNRTSDMFYVSESPPKVTLETVSGQGDTKDNKVDSFLVMVGLDKSNNIIDNENSPVSGKKSDKYEKYNLLEPERDVTKVSTPILCPNKKIENFSFTSPVSALNEGFNDDVKPGNTPQSYYSALDKKTLEELKEFIKINNNDLGDDNRNYFLHIMMALTKQKLYLEKQLSVFNDQMRFLMHTQNALLESNRKLALEIGLLKAEKSVSKKSKSFNSY